MVLLLLIILLMLFIIIEKCLVSIEKYTNHEIIFYKKENLCNILKKDEDQYVNSLFTTDLKVRNVKNKEEYLEKIDQSIINPTNDVINIIKNCILKINQRLEYYLKNNGNFYEYINISKFKNIQWKIGFMGNKEYENGLPHTRNDIILLNKNKILLNTQDKIIKTLLHEKVHVYQKLYPEDVKLYLKNKKFIKLKKMTKYDNIRANPDLDDYIYQDKYFNTYKAVYNNNPTSIEDITYFPQNSQFYEHPFERMAIEFETIMDN